jgi:hypothetical protein
LLIDGVPALIVPKTSRGLLVTGGTWQRTIVMQGLFRLESFHGLLSGCRWPLEPLLTPERLLLRDNFLCLKLLSCFNFIHDSLDEIDLLVLRGKDSSWHHAFHTFRSALWRRHLLELSFNERSVLLDDRLCWRYNSSFPFFSIINKLLLMLLDLIFNLGYLLIHYAHCVLLDAFRQFHGHPQRVLLLYQLLRLQPTIIKLQFLTSKEP